MAPTAGVKMSEDPRPERREKVMMKCHSSGKMSISTELLEETNIKRTDVHTRALCHSHQTSEQKHTPSNHQPSRALGIEDWADLHAAEEREEGKDTEYPANAGGRVMCQLVRAQVGLKGANGVQDAKGGHHSTEGAKDDEPGTEATFRIGIAIFHNGSVRGRGLFIVILGWRFVLGDYRGVVGGLSVG